MECPTCGKILATEQGMRQHHTEVHGESLPNRTCDDCGIEFYDPKSQRTYCEDCYSEAGEKNGNYAGATEMADCARCGASFEYYPSNKDGVYCSECVADADGFLGTPYAETVDAERIERNCDYCDEPMLVLECNRRLGHGRFCSNEYQNSWMSEQWGNGETVYNGRWREVRRTVLERDNHQCQKCGVTPLELGQNPDVHHIKPVGKFDDPQKSHTVDNLVALCKSCHAQVEHGNMELLPPS
jgi:5-methylcytosine-specific restriction endonuclease McrA